jgi:hypothetical protein
MTIVEDDRKLKEFNEQHDKEYSSPPLDLTKPQGTPGRPPTNLTPQEQKVMMELQNKMQASSPNMNVKSPVSTAPYVPPTIQTAGNVCPDCGVMHPPLPVGQRCPNAKANLETISDVEIGEFLASWRNIIISQIEKRNIKNAKKVFQKATVILAQFLEEYKEEANVEENPTKREAVS